MEMEVEKYGSPARAERMRGEIDEARAELLRLVQIVCAGTPPETYAAAEKLQAAAWQLAQLRRALEPQIQREAELHVKPLSIITADRANYATITIGGLTVQAVATLDSNGLTRVTPEQPAPVSEGDVVRVTLAGRGAAPPVASFENVPERRTVAGCVHEYPPGCPEGTTRCWLCGEADALPPRGPYTSPKPSRTSDPG